MYFFDGGRGLKRTKEQDGRAALGGGFLRARLVFEAAGGAAGGLIVGGAVIIAVAG